MAFLILSIVFQQDLLTHCPYTFPFTVALMPEHHPNSFLLLHFDARHPGICIFFIYIQFGLFRFRGEKKARKSAQPHNQMLIYGQHKYCSVLQCEGLEQGNMRITRGEFSSFWTPTEVMYDFVLLSVLTNLYLYLYTFIIETRFNSTCNCDVVYGYVLLSDP